MKKVFNIVRWVVTYVRNVLMAPIVQIVLIVRMYKAFDGDIDAANNYMHRLGNHVAGM